jgi:hypothetical protein
VQDEVADGDGDPRMDIAALEAHFGVSFPQRHREAWANRSDPIHDACHFLVPASPNRLLHLTQTNQRLHAADSPNRWPAFLVAFATAGCGDYFAYDTRTTPMRVVYIDPIGTPEDNLANSDGTLDFADFDLWYRWKLTGRR